MSANSTIAWVGVSLRVRTSAAARLGITLVEYDAQRAAGQKWCTRCKQWHPISDFAGDRSRGDGLSAACARSRYVRSNVVGPGARRIFVNSMSDLFHPEPTDAFIAEVFTVMARAPQHTFQVLTKRHGRMRSLLKRPSFRDNLLDRVPDMVWPLSNVWLGVSVENQHWANIRVPVLLDTPAAVRWISAEPLLGPVDLHWCGGVDAIERDWVGGPRGGSGAPHPFVDWVVVGGESGPHARPMEADWAHALRDSCIEAKVPFFFKQLGTRLARDLGVPGKGEEFEHLPAEFQIREYPTTTLV